MPEEKVVTRCRSPAVAAYLRPWDGDRHDPFVLSVLTVVDGELAALTSFSTVTFDAFGLPAHLPAAWGRR